MKLNDLRKVKSNDRLFWNDPDGGCSRYYTIKRISVNHNIVTIEEPNGSILECYARELQWVKI